jgi:hypothetical protein
VDTRIVLDDALATMRDATCGSRGFAEAMAGWDREPPPELLRPLKELGLIWFVQRRVTTLTLV